MPTVTIQHIGGRRAYALPDRAASFSAGNGYLRLPGGLSLPQSTAWSLAFWYTWDAGPLNNNRMALGQISNRSNFGDDLFYYSFDNALGVARGVFLDTAAGGNSCGGGSDATNTWRFLVLCYTPTGGSNGRLDQSINGGSITSVGMTSLMRAGTNCDFFVGDLPEYESGGVGPGTLHFTGRIDSLGIWNRTLLAADNTALYNSGAGYQLSSQLPAAQQTSLLAWYPLDEAANSTVYQDVSGNAHHLQVVGTVQSGGARGT